MFQTIWTYTKPVLAQIIYSAAKAYFDTEFFDRVEQLVLMQLDDNIPGDEKKANVRQWIKFEIEDVKTSFIDHVIQIVLLKYRGND